MAATLHAAAAGSTTPLSTTNSQIVQPPSSQPIPWSDLGAKATAQYTGDGLAVLTAADGTVRLRCVFQKLEGEVTREGLWLTSTGEESRGERFRVVATEVGRSADFGVRRQNEAPPPLPGDVIAVAAETSLALQFPPLSKALLPTGTVAIDGHMARLNRPGLVEEYSVSMDGVRQDFIILSRPLNSQLSTLNSGAGELQVRLAVTGARVEPTANGAQLVLERSGRKIAYNRLRVTDATGKELPARMEVMRPGESQRDSIVQPKVASRRATLGQATKTGPTLKGLQHDAEPRHLQPSDATPSGLEIISSTPPRVGAALAKPGPDEAIPSGLNETGAELAGRTGIEGEAQMLAVLVNDADAVYPVRIDPTFSDANWISMGGIVGPNGGIAEVVVDGSGNLYIGGDFTMVGDVLANNIAKWDGSRWSALGSGVGGFYHQVTALAVSGSDLYVGGTFATAGGSPAHCIAKWNGSSWSALGSGLVGSFPSYPNFRYWACF